MNVNQGLTQFNGKVLHSFIHCFWIFHKQFSLIKYSCQEILLISRCFVVVFRIFFAKYIISQNTEILLKIMFEIINKHIHTDGAEKVSKCAMYLHQDNLDNVCPSNYTLTSFTFDKIELNINVEHKHQRKILLILFWWLLLNKRQLPHLHWQ